MEILKKFVESLAFEYMIKKLSHESGESMETKLNLEEYLEKQKLFLQQLFIISEKYGINRHRVKSHINSDAKI